MELFHSVLAVIAGALGPVQAGINAQLRVWTRDPILAALISFAVGTLALLGYVIAFRVNWPPLHTAGTLPWWAWTGGMLGAFFVAVSIVLVPKLGAATLMALMISGQLLSGIILDHFGLVGYEVRELNIWRLLGVAMLVTGVILIKRF